MKDSTKHKPPARIRQAADLAELLSAVLRHPDLPVNVYNAIGDSVCELNVDCDAPEYLRLALADREPEAVERFRQMERRCHR